MGRRLHFMGQNYCQICVGMHGIMFRMGFSSLSYWLLLVEFAISIFALDVMRGMNIIIRSDSEGVIVSSNKGHSSNLEINASMHQSESILDAFHMHVSLVYIPSASNLADLISQSIFPLSPNRCSSHFVPSHNVAHFFVGS